MCGVYYKKYTTFCSIIFFDYQFGANVFYDTFVIHDAAKHFSYCCFTSPTNHANPNHERFIGLA